MWAAVALALATVVLAAVRFPKRWTVRPDSEPEVDGTAATLRPTRTSEYEVIVVGVATGLAVSLPLIPRRFETDLRFVWILLALSTVTAAVMAVLFSGMRRGQWVRIDEAGILGGRMAVSSWRAEIVPWSDVPRVRLDRRGVLVVESLERKVYATVTLRGIALLADVVERRLADRGGPEAARGLRAYLAPLRSPKR